MAISSSHREEMFGLIEQWQQSGISQKGWCEQNGIRYHIFHYWYKRYRNQPAVAPATTSSFIQLQVKENGSQPLMELLLAGNKRLLFYQPVSIDYLKALIA
jgi:hypothetical protein